jgi:hypothetical protein
VVPPKSEAEIVALLGGRGRRSPQVVFEAMLDASGVPSMLADLMPSGGRPRQLGARPGLLGAPLE